MRSMNESLPVGMRSRIPKPSMYFVLEATHAIFGIVYCFSDKMEGSIYSVQCAESNNGWGPSVCFFFLVDLLGFGEGEIVSRYQELCSYNGNRSAIVL